MSDITYDLDRDLEGEEDRPKRRRPPLPRPKPGAKSTKPAKAAAPKRATMTPRQLEMLTRMADSIFRTGSPPGRRAIALALRVTVNAVACYGEALRKKGVLRRPRVKGEADTITPLGWNVLRRFGWRAPPPDKWCTFAVVVGLVTRGEIAHEVPEPPEVHPDAIDAP